MSTSYQPQTPFTAAATSILSYGINMINNIIVDPQNVPPVAMICNPAGKGPPGDSQKAPSARALPVVYLTYSRKNFNKLK